MVGLRDEWEEIQRELHPSSTYNGHNYGQPTPYDHSTTITQQSQQPPIAETESDFEE